MQNQTFKRFLKRIIEEGPINASSTGSSIRNSPEFTTLITAGFIKYLPGATGGGSFHVQNSLALEKYFADKFPDEPKKNLTAVDNVHAMRNSKTGKRTSQNVILLKGQQRVILNGNEVDLEIYTQTYGTFAAVLKTLQAERVCFVENLDVYFLAEKLIGSDYVFIHTYGGIGKSVVEKIAAQQILVFPDYDFQGLNNFLLVKSICPNAILFFPENYEYLFQTRSRTLKTKHGREQQPSKRVMQTQDALVIKIRTDIFQHKKFLEQQALFQ